MTPCKTYKQIFSRLVVNSVWFRAFFVADFITQNLSAGFICLKKTMYQFQCGIKAATICPEEKVGFWHQLILNTLELRHININPSWWERSVGEGAGRERITQSQTQLTRPLAERKSLMRIWRTLALLLSSRRRPLRRRVMKNSCGRVSLATRAPTAGAFCCGIQDSFASFQLCEWEMPFLFRHSRNWIGCYTSQRSRMQF
jgi:hypothetical protein